MRGYYGNLKNHQSTPSKVKIELFNYARIAILVHRYSNVEKCRRKLKLIVLLFLSEIQQYYTRVLRILLQYIRMFCVNTLLLIVFGTLGVVFLLLLYWRTWSFFSRTFQMKHIFPIFAHAWYLYIWILKQVLEKVCTKFWQAVLSQKESYFKLLDNLPYNNFPANKFC